MRTLFWSLLAFGLCAIAANLPQPSPLPSIAEAGTDQFLLRAYLVELQDDEDIDNFFSSLASAGIAAERGLTFDYKVFKGASLRVVNTTQSGDDLASRIASRPQVRNAWPLRLVDYTQPEIRSAASGLSNKKITKRDQGLPKSYIPHVETGIDKLHAAGFTGKGKRIGIVDTGIDYNHPTLGGCFGKGCKVSYGWDFVGDGEGESWYLNPDDDPLEDVNFHGTHVAGIVGGLQDDLGFVGAAPDAELGMYKTVGRHTMTGRDDVLAAALCMAYEDGSDIITMSMGLPNTNWAEHFIGVVASRIVERGVPVTISASNDGYYGPFQSRAPAVGKGVTSVGASVSALVPYLLFEGSWMQDGGEAQDFGWYGRTQMVEEDTTLPLYALDDMSEGSQACEDALDDMPDLSGKFVLVQSQGASVDCNLGTQLWILGDLGAEYVILFTRFNETIPDLPFPIAAVKVLIHVPPSQVDRWLKALESGADVNVTVPAVDLSSTSWFFEAGVNDRSAGAVTEFSSWGPSWELNFKPQVLAPGQDVLSTLPLSLGAYGVLSGTSMACPMVGGLYALLMEARGTSDPALLQGALMSQAQPVDCYMHNVHERRDYLAPVAQQGAGLIQGWEAAQVETVLSLSSFSLNDTDHFARKVTLSIRNSGDDEVIYNLYHVEAAAMNTFNEDTLWPQRHPIEAVEAAAKIGFSSTELTVGAGQTKDVTISVSAPSNLPAELLPLYGGYVQIKGSNNDTLSLPYLGVAGSLRDTAVLLPGEEGHNYLYAQGDTYTPVEANTTFRIERRDSVSASAQPGDPGIRVVRRVGTKIQRVDVVALDRSNLSTTGFFEYDVVGHFVGSPFEFVGGTQALGALDPLVDYIADTHPFWGVLADGTVLPEGRYQIVLSALRIFGDPDERDDWDIVDLVPFVLEHA